MYKEIYILQFSICNITWNIINAQFKENVLSYIWYFLNGWSLKTYNTSINSMMFQKVSKSAVIIYVSEAAKTYFVKTFPRMMVPNITMLVT